MKIALFTEIFDCGGVDTFIANLINNWPNKDDHFVIIANANYPGLRVVEERLTRPCEIVRHDVLIYSNVLNGNFPLKLLRKVLSPLLRYLLIGYNILAFRKLLLDRRCDRLMVINGGYPGGDSCRAATISWGLFSGKPAAIHNFHSIVTRAPWYQTLQEYVTDRLVCRFSGQFVTVSRAAASSMSRRPSISSRKAIRYIYNGLDSVRTPAPDKNVRDEVGIPESAPLCLMLGTYGAQKGHRFLFTAFRKVLETVPDAHLLVCGYGFRHEVRQVTSLVGEFQLADRVHLMGFRKDLSHLLDNADVLVVASQSYEAFGFTSVEAMAHKVPVVATNVGGIPEVVADNEGGYCVDSCDPEAFAQRVVMLLGDKALRLEQGNRGYERFQQLFTATTMSAKYAEVIRLQKINVREES